IVQTMFDGLRDAGYLVANPMKAVMKGFALPSTKLNVSRSFTEAEWAHALNTLDTMGVGAEQLRMRCILELLVSSGLRLDELARSTWSDVRRETLPGLPACWVLSVLGKRSKRRDVPLTDEVVDLLRRHEIGFAIHDAVMADRQWTSESSAGGVPLRSSLIRALGPSVDRWVRTQAGGVVKRPVTEQGGAALSASGIAAALKRFFGRAARSAAAAGLDTSRFERASTHWMRHTFVRQALVDGVAIEVVSELAGHASIDTTTIYASQELARKIQAISKMRRRTAVTP
ncbi:MAG: site-specific integrase, partial [Variovorax sp.]